MNVPPWAWLAVVGVILVIRAIDLIERRAASAVKMTPIARAIRCNPRKLLAPRAHKKSPAFTRNAGLFFGGTGGI